jgi:uncharacterized peroxidase-related enzyme
MTNTDPHAPGAAAGFLAPVEPDAAAEELYADDVAELGYVMNVSRLWAYDATAVEGIFAVARRVAGDAGLSIRHRLLIVLATSAVRRSSYCVFAWGTKFSAELAPSSAAAVVRGDADPAGLDPAEVALVRWARTVAAAPHDATRADVDHLRDQGWTDRQIFAITTFAALRLAFASINDALGAAPDPALATSTPKELREAVTFGRLPAVSS